MIVSMMILITTHTHNLPNYINTYATLACETQTQIEKLCLNLCDIYYVAVNKVYWKRQFTFQWV